MIAQKNPMCPTSDPDKANKTDLTDIIQTGSSASQTISEGTYFYLNGSLVRAIADISSGSTFTLNTNYKVVNGALNETAGSVSVTADGSKTNSVLFNELFALIDTNKISATSVLVKDADVFPINNIGGTSYTFSNLSVTSSLSTILAVTLKSTGSTYYRCMTTSSATTFSDFSAGVPTSGTVYKIIY